MRMGPYVFAAGNALGLKCLALEDGRLVYENERGPAELCFSRGKVIETEYPGWPGEPALTAAGWLDDRQLRIRCHAIGNAPCGFDMVLAFAEEFVTVQCVKSYDPRTEGYEGVASGIPAQEV